MYFMEAMWVCIRQQAEEADVEEPAAGDKQSKPSANADAAEEAALGFDVDSLFADSGPQDKAVPPAGKTPPLPAGEPASRFSRWFQLEASPISSGPAVGAGFLFLCPALFCPHIRTSGAHKKQLSATPPGSFPLSKLAQLSAVF